ncbi:MAG TPA: Crp/Fnr family transcriptional regulator [Candidatus Merdiplasma excrementigallinarum]|uniref:Crp/Fnr family transcriptional regulator n=1 Tax=Candidatus Merdiplasma excrementigallinarum TaxID=2840864 RepID=A0A9D1T7K1_9FIRM|nr:Crp/Fnr family transcriptional regulator [Candidatus Merdiplasma excrementigallinarum]
MEIKEFFPIWDKMTAGQQEALVSGARRQVLKKGTVIHRDTEDCAGLLLLEEGQLRAYMLSEEGREITVYRLLEGDICLFSASCMIRSLQSDIVIEAERDSRMWVISPGVYRKLMDESALIANYTNEIMASRLTDVMWLMEQVMWKSLDRRLASFLLEEADLEGSGSLKITHEMISNHLGTAREVVTRMLRYFQSEGMVRLSRGAVEITDRKKLEKLGQI